MDASYVVGHLHGVAVPAIYRLQIVGMGKALIGSIGVTGKTGVAVVYRF
jgi:hypothetical protein